MPLIVEVRPTAAFIFSAIVNRHICGCRLRCAISERAEVVARNFFRSRRHS
jgi:hypothetical protein